MYEVEADKSFCGIAFKDTTNNLTNINGDSFEQVLENIDVNPDEYVLKEMEEDSDNSKLDNHVDSNSTMDKSNLNRKGSPCLGSADCGKLDDHDKSKYDAINIQLGQNNLNTSQESDETSAENVGQTCIDYPIVRIMLALIIILEICKFVLGFLRFLRKNREKMRKVLQRGSQETNPKVRVNSCCFKMGGLLYISLFLSYGKQNKAHNFFH